MITGQVGSGKSTSLRYPASRLHRFAFWVLSVVASAGNLHGVAVLLCGIAAAAGLLRRHGLLEAIRSITSLPSMNGRRYRCRYVTSRSGGISVAGSKPGMCRAKPRTAVIRRIHTELDGSASGRCTQARAALMIIVEAPVASGWATKSEKAAGVGQPVTQWPTQTQVFLNVSGEDVRAVVPGQPAAMLRSATRSAFASPAVVPRSD